MITLNAILPVIISHFKTVPKWLMFSNTDKVLGELMRL